MSPLFGTQMTFVFTRKTIIECDYYLKLAIKLITGSIMRLLLRLKVKTWNGFFGDASCQAQLFCEFQNKVTRRSMFTQMLKWRKIYFQIFVLLFLLLLVGSYTLIERFRRRDQKDLYSTEDDEIKVYRISLLFCIFSFAVAIGSAFLLPLSIISNEVLLLYPNSYYVQWLNSSLIQGLWNHVFLFSNLAIFVLLPFAYLFSESSGFLGHKKGIVPRLYETSVVFVLLIFVVIGLIYVLLAVFYPERSSFMSLLSKFKFFFKFVWGLPKSDVKFFVQNFSLIFKAQVSQFPYNLK